MFFLRLPFATFLAIGAAALLWGENVCAAPDPAIKPKLDRQRCLDDLLSLAAMTVSQPLDPDSIEHVRKGDPKNPSVVFIPGNMDTWTTFAAVQSELAVNFDVVSYSPRGHGRTPAVGWNYSPEQMADDLVSLLDKLGIQQAHLVGHSQGARTAAYTAYKYPGRVLSVTAVDMPANPTHFDDRLASFDLARTIASKLPESYPSDRVAKEQISEILGSDLATTLVNSYGMDLQNGQFKVGISIPAYLLSASQGGSMDLRPMVRQVECPILVVVGIRLWEH